MCVVFEIRVLFIRVPYYIGDIKGDPNFENYPCAQGVFGSMVNRLPCHKSRFKGIETSETLSEFEGRICIRCLVKP